MQTSVRTHEHVHIEHYIKPGSYMYTYTGSNNNAHLPVENHLETSMPQPCTHMHDMHDMVRCILEYEP